MHNHHHTLKPSNREVLAGSFSASKVKYCMGLVAILQQDQASSLKVFNHNGTIQDPVYPIQVQYLWISSLITWIPKTI